MEGNPEDPTPDPFTYEEFCIIFGIAILAIILNAINDFLQRNQNEDRTVAVHAQSCKGNCKPLFHYTLPYCRDAGVNVEAFNDEGSSSFVNVFLEARKSADKKAAQKMFDEQITIFRSNKLHEYVRKEHLRVVKYLLTLELMDLNVQDNDGNTPLHIACENGNIDIAKALLTALGNLESMDLNIQNNDGNTPLHKACENGNIDVAKALLTAGANQNVENKEKKKPFQVAKPKDVEALRKLLSNRRGGWNNKRGKPPKYQG